jgi:hypothetical protein
MKTLAALILCVIPCLAEDTSGVQLKRVASVNWDLRSGKLEWTIQTGVEGKDGGFVPSSEERYQVSPKDAVMISQGQERKFTGEEATWLEKLLYALTVYCAESTVWWYRGDASPSPDGTTTTTPSDPKSKPGPAPADGPQKFMENRPPVPAPSVFQPASATQAH